MDSDPSSHQTLHTKELHANTQQTLLQGPQYDSLGPDEALSSASAHSNIAAHEIEEEHHTSVQPEEGLPHSQISSLQGTIHVGDGKSMTRRSVDDATGMTLRCDRRTRQPTPSWIKSFAAKFPNLHLASLNRAAAGEGRIILSKHDNISALHHHIGIGRCSKVPLYPWDSDSSSIPHQLLYHSETFARPSPVTLSSCSKEVLLSPRVLQRRLLDAKATAFPSPHGLAAYSTGFFQSPGAVLTHIIWPVMPPDVLKMNNAVQVPTGPIDSAVIITELACFFQERIFRVAHKIAVAHCDQDTMRAYYNIHFRSLFLNDSDLKNQRETINRSRTQMTKSWRTVMTIRSAYENGAVFATEREVTIRSYRVKYNLQANTTLECYPDAENLQRIRVNERLLITLLELWDKNWRSMGGDSAEAISCLRNSRNRLARHRWTAGRRGWTGLLLGNDKERVAVVEGGNTLVAEDEAAEGRTKENEGGKTEVEDDAGKDYSVQEEGA